MRKSAQAVSEYVLLVAVIATAVTLMQLYFQRSVRAVVKIAADEVGGQKEGSVNEDYALDWIEKETTQTNTTTFGSSTEVKFPGAAVTRSINQVTTQEGGITFGVSQEKK